MNRLTFFILLLCAFFSGCSNNQPETVYEWRGSNRSGIYNESNLLKSWPENGPLLLWETTGLGAGYGSPTVAGNRLFVMGTTDSTSLLYAFDLKGKQLHTTEIGEEWVVNFPGSRGTPTVSGNLVYTVTGKGDLSCVDARSGEIKWKKNFVVDFGGISPRFGFAESPLVDGERLYCVPGGSINNVVCLNRFTGDLIWTCEGKKERSGYNSAAMITVDSKKIVAAFSAYHLMGIDAEKGELLWVHEQINTPADKREPGVGDTHGNTVLYSKPMLYYVEGDGNCAVALKLSADGASIEQVWNNALVDNYMGGIVLIDKNIYSCAFSKNDLVSIDVSNGVVTDSLALGRGTLVAADDMLYYYNNSGEVHLVDYQNGDLKAISSFKINKGSKEHFAHPVIDKGVLYIRHGEYLGAYKIGK
jgi:outer membrane protein assembly factor BamB